MNEKCIGLRAVLFCLALSGLSWAAEEFPDITHKELKAAIAEKNVVLLDCNGSKSYAQHHIPGALDFSAVKDDLSKALPADKGALIVAYCGSPTCPAYKSGPRRPAN